jgi:hypothetical protein
MADKDDDTAPEIDPQTRRPKVLVPLRRPSAGGGGVRDISPQDTNLGGGSRMIGRAPTYKKGGAVKLGSPAVSAPCKDTKTIKCY